MDPKQLLALTFDPSRILTAKGLTPDPWQRDLLLSNERQMLLNCSRQSGKSTVVSALALHQALIYPSSLILLLSPSQRQSFELYRKVRDAFRDLKAPIPTLQESESRRELANGSRIISLPGKEETIRSFSGVSLIILDEAARIPDDLYRSVRPMPGFGAANRHPPSPVYGAFRRAVIGPALTPGFRVARATHEAPFTGLLPVRL